MKTEVIRQELPTLLPQGWKKNVATILGIHPQTVSRAVKVGKGPTYGKIMETATKVYGTVTKREVLK